MNQSAQIKEEKSAENEQNLHWSDEEEVISSSKPLKLLLRLFSIQPKWLVHILIFPVGFFFFLFSKRARTDCYVYQKQLRTFTSGKAPKRISALKQIISFSLCVLEKMAGWLGKVKYKNLIVHDDDLQELINLLEQKKGAVLIGSHLGNIELLRSLSSFNRTGVSREVPVTTIMEIKSTAVFNKTIAEINPGASFNVIDPSDITPETIIFLQEQIEQGGLVVFAADRTSANVRNRCIRKTFLGKEADFPYGVFLLASLLKAPTYYVFGLRSKDLTLFPKNHMFVEKSKVSFDCPRNEREGRINDLCGEFVKILEKYTVQFPYQFYNFYNFWKLHTDFDAQKSNLK